MEGSVVPSWVDHYAVVVKDIKQKVSKGGEETVGSKEM